MSDSPNSTTTRHELLFLNYFRLAQALVYVGLAFTPAGMGWPHLDSPGLARLVAVMYLLAAARVSHRAWGDDAISVFAFGAHDELADLGQPTFHVEYHRADLRYANLSRAGPSVGNPLMSTWTTAAPPSCAPPI